MIMNKLGDILKNKNTWIVLLLVGLIVSIGWSTIQGRNQAEREARIATEAKNMVYQQAVAAYNAKFDTLTAQNTALQSQLGSLVTEYRAGKQREATIVNNYKNVYEKINSSTTVAEQLADTKELLAESARLPLERD